MFTTRFKIALTTLVILVTTLFSTFLFADCEMMAMIAKIGNYISWENADAGSFDDPYDYFQFMRDESHAGGTWPNGPNDDGYGVIYYSDDGSVYFNENDYFDILNQAWYKTSRDSNGVWHYPSYGNGWSYYGDTNPHWQWGTGYEPLDDIIEPTIMDNNAKASIVLGHDRNGTGGHGNHPFRLQIDSIGKHYTFEHNGDVGSKKSDFYQRIVGLYPSWFTNNDSNWEGDISNLSTWIDSELYFHYILANIKYADGDIIQGIYNALSYDFDPGTGVDTILESDMHANFIMSDGSSLYAYRCTDEQDYDLKYVENDNFWGITSGTGSGTQLNVDNLAVFSPYGELLLLDLNNTYTNFFTSGTISENTTWNTPIIMLTGDVVVPEEITLTINSEVYFLTHSSFQIFGTVNLQDNASINLDHASEVLIENNGLLFLDWGSTITGVTPTTYGATPPGHMVGGEPIIYGDRIIAQNGGKITTGDDQNPGDEITIASSSGVLWDGIFIKNPDDDPLGQNPYWFVNCDISGIRKLSIEDVGFSTRNTANLKLYQTDFHNAGQIVVRDGHHLTIYGNVSEEEYCYIQNTPVYPIVTYESSVDLNYVHIGGETENDDLENGGGIYIYESSRANSKIRNCVIKYNTGDGIKLDSVPFDEFNNNTIENNTGFGMMCYVGTEFTGNLPFNSITIRNNGFAEYTGWQTTFEMDDYDAGIIIGDNNYGTGSDYYLLMNLNWDEENPVDIRGTNITAIDHLYPTNSDAWTHSPQITGAKELLNSASFDYANENYESAKQTLYQLLSEYLYSPEAINAVYYLYYIENLTEEDFTDLRDYLINLNVDEETYLYTVIKKVSAKTLMKEQDYITAIAELEDMIINSELPDEVISAMIDQGYCYLKLSESGDRAEPEYCTVRTKTLDEYQEKVKELESQFSFFPDEENENSTPIAGNILSLYNYPNPFNPATTIKFGIPQAADVTIKIYDILGQEVKTLVNRNLAAGFHTVNFNASNLISGMYIYRIQANGVDGSNFTDVKKMLLVK